MDDRKVFEVIDKHMSYHKMRMVQLAFKSSLGFDVEGERCDSASALAALEMLKNELSGKCEY